MLQSGIPKHYAERYRDAFLLGLRAMLVLRGMPPSEFTMRMLRHGYPLMFKTAGGCEVRLTVEKLQPVWISNHKSHRKYHAPKVNLKYIHIPATPDTKNGYREWRMTTDDQAQAVVVHLDTIGLRIAPEEEFHVDASRTRATAV